MSSDIETKAPILNRARNAPDQRGVSLKHNGLATALTQLVSSSEAGWTGTDDDDRQFAQYSK